ncbi:hypothetical protein KC363_g3692 [Hortaea werneckii]|nr:hypothetical protein KC325_g4483 [Hortaea werneckii]KAI6993315.1 hypothetical protein KC359_g5219 [Hortaea werneckii]KAI7145412.1 hypothetical protein KC344_g4504 [Hortaea werneckii]KAI7174151.1 hypothetical protein KC360_g4467 [Hortaea werneckii]KAI7191752.1 hypothetical protein KC363_g3692 [Hortaea werneckii]
MAPQSQQQQQQQQAYHQNAQLPRTDLSAIMNSLPPEQLAVLVQAIQSGALTMPPQVAAPISQTSTPTQNNLPPPPPPPPPPQQQQQSSRVPPIQQEPVRTDKEEGELEEGEEMEDPAPKPRTRSPLRMSKKRSASPKDPYGRSVNRRTSAQHQQTDGNPAKSRRVSEYGSAVGGDVRRTSGPVNGGNSSSSLGAAGKRVDPGSAARNFVRTMHDNGYTFDQLASEVPNSAALRRMYVELGLPLRTAPSGSGARNGEQVDWKSPQSHGAAPTTTTPNKPQAADSRNPAEARKPAATAKAQPPANREEYLARLAKARSKPSASGGDAVQDGAKMTQSFTSSTASTPGQLGKTAQTPSAASHQPDPTKKLGTQPRDMPRAQDRNNEEPRVDKPKANPIKTELLKERLAALRAKNAAQAAGNSAQPPGQSATNHTSSPVTHSPSASSPAPPQPSTGAATYGSLGNGIAGLSGHQPEVAASNPQPRPISTPATEPSAPAPVQTSFSPAPPLTPGRAFSALPGLFMGTGFPPQPPANVPTQQSFSASQAHSTTEPHQPMDSNFTSHNHAPAGAPSKQSFGPSRSDSGSEPVIIHDSDQEDGEDTAMQTTSGQPTSASVKPGPIPGFPPISTAASGPSTPGTPMNKADHQALVEQHTKMLQKAKMELAERQARAEAIRKSNGHAAAFKNDAVSPQPAASSPISNSKRSAPAAIDMAQQQTPSRPMSAAAVAREQEMAALRKRQAELELQLRQGGVTPISAVEPPKMSGALPVTESSERTTSDLAPAVDHTLEDTVAVADARPNIEDDGAEKMDVSSDEEGEISDDAEPAVGPPTDSLEVGSDTKSPDNGPVAPQQAEEAASKEMSEYDEDDAMDESSAASSSDDDDDIEEESQEQPPAPAQAATTTISNTEHQVDDSDQENSSGSSEDDDEEYEPEPVSQPINPPAPVVINDGPSLSAKTISSATALPEQSLAESDLAPELQPTAPSSFSQEHTTEGQMNSRRHYTPYVSPLACFRDYRFHPAYTDTVSGGYRSLTYSHRIDPWNAFCPFELQGGTCNDRSCGFQHFGNVGVSDTVLLQHLGTNRTPTHNPDEERKWKEGLGTVIKQLRTTNQGKDANAIAAKIAEFRREFIGDDSKVLNLG